MIDELDRKILNMLIADGRQSNRVITRKIVEEGTRISERGLGKRIAKLERAEKSQNGAFFRYCFMSSSRSTKFFGDDNFTVTSLGTPMSTFFMSTIAV